MSFQTCMTSINRGTENYTFLKLEKNVLLFVPQKKESRTGLTSWHEFKFRWTVSAKGYYVRRTLYFIVCFFSPFTCLFPVCDLNDCFCSLPSFTSLWYEGLILYAGESACLPESVRDVSSAHSHWPLRRALMNIQGMFIICSSRHFCFSLN